MEVLFRPELRGRPVVVLSNNDGCIIARSQEAKALGLKMANPTLRCVPSSRNTGLSRSPVTTRFMGR
nr:hypothetical protein [Stutzerimonas zhaodongensis]